MALSGFAGGMEEDKSRSLGDDNKGEVGLGQSRRVLILGGTSDAAWVAGRLVAWPGLTVISSLAGRVNEPKVPVGLVRSGGFGGVDGLKAYLAEERIDAVIDATHPFAAKIRRNAEAACASLGVPLIRFERPAWEAIVGDCWVTVANVQAAARIVDEAGKRVFLSIGRQELGAFSACANAWFLVRTIDEPQVMLPVHSKLLLERGPFALEREREMLREERISTVVSKNSGGAATYAKIAAARELGLRVVMIGRPGKGTAGAVYELDEVLVKVANVLANVAERREL
jgi:precorrin-6A/cobalt-precorrin-6A reductase